METNAKMKNSNGWFDKPEDIKIHTYVICKNEEQFVEGFLETVKDTDTLAVMDTGSTDKTFELFKGYAETPEWKGRLFVWQEIVTPWDFGKARTLSMKNTPEDTDYCYCIDLDERLTAGFYQKLRERIFACGNIPERIYYKYAWSHTANGEPDNVFWYDKTHGPKGWIWKFPCHEALDLDENYKSLYGPSVYIDGGETIWLHHWPDQTKSRGSYLGLLKRRAEEYPEDSYGIFYLAREEGFVQNWEASLGWFQRLYYRLCDGKVKDDMLMKPAVALEIAKIYTKVNRPKEAELFFKLAIEYDPRVIDGYMEYAQWLAYQGRPADSLDILQQAQKKATHIQDWRTSPALATDWKKKQVIADCLCWLGEDELAMQTIQAAFEEITKNGEEDNARKYGFYSDYAFIKQKIAKHHSIEVIK